MIFPRHRIITYFFVFLAAIVAGCASPPKILPLICPTPPIPICKPGTYDKTTIDTTAELGHVQTHITMLPAPPNSNEQDYAIGFIPTSNGYIALITSDRRNAEDDNGGSGNQRLFSARFFGTTRYGPMYPVHADGVSEPMGTAFYSKADKLLYFSAKEDNGDPDDYDLYTAKVEVENDEVTLRDVRTLDKLNTANHFESQPTLDPSGTHIYFVSDRPGGDGGTDIWYSERTSATSSDWTMPQPLPEPVNSPCDEISPFIPSFDPNTLYFASNGHETVGGYDLFKTHIHNGQFSEPENLGKPINTEADEVFPSALNDTAFFWASNTPTAVAGMNLYTITQTRIGPQTVHGQIPQDRIGTEHLSEDTLPVEKLGPVEIVAHVTRGADNRPATGADIYVREDSQEIYRGTIPANGEIGFKVNREQEYDVGAETQDAFFDVRHLDLHGVRDSVVHVYLHLPDTLVIRINFPFDDYQHPYEYTIDENGQPSSMTWQRALDLAAHSALASTNKLRELLLIGHTDSLGTDAYNKNLGMQRATFVASELEKRGVAAKIVHIESAGRTEPVMRRPEESDEVFRLRSRRVDFVKVFK